MPDGTQIRRNVPTLHEALRVKEELELKAQGQPVDFVLRKTCLTQEELVEAEHAVRRLREAQNAQPHLKGKSLQFVVEYALSNYKELTKVKTIRDAVSEFLAVKREKKKRQRTITDYTSRLGKLVKEHGDLMVNQTTTEHLEGLVQGCGYEGVTQNHYRTKFRTFFKWCRKRKYCISNPAEDIEVAEVDEHEPVIFTLDQAKSLLRAALTHEQGLMVPYIAVGLFGGLRPAEIGFLRWNNVNLKSKLITVTGFTAKRRKRRHVEVSDNLAQWLLPYVGRPFVPKNFRRDFDAVRRLAGFKGSLTKKGVDENLQPWHEDVIRHTAISHHYADSDDEGKTAKWAGQSPDVMHSHYKGLVSKPDSKIFWSWTPQTIHNDEHACQQPQKLDA
ncbi:MAG TPA: tyrosine-type recombinase/integrase [Verrucomicrobiota bacterium]|nr:tyrosine-type recombinase/integrase [Verrucomicrobiota bacterium]